MSTKFQLLSTFLFSLVALSLCAAASQPMNLRDQVKGLSPLAKSEFTTKVKAALLTDYFKIALICLERFKRCSQLLNRGFCVSADKRFSFYLWAKKVAGQILDEPGVHCPRQLMLQFYINNF